MSKEKEIITAIYKITSPDESIYIGGSKNLSSRWKDYSRKHHNEILKESFEKYGKKNHKFEVLYVLPNNVERNVIDEYEKFYYNQYKETGYKMMNIREPGWHGKQAPESMEKHWDTRRKNGNDFSSEDAKLKMSEKAKKRQPNRKGMKLKEEQCKNKTSEKKRVFAI